MEYFGINFKPLDDSKLSIEEMVRFEKEYNIHIPQSLRELFQITNNSFIEDAVIEVDEIGEVMPEGWCGIGEFGMNYKIDTFKDYLPEKMLPFAEDPGGNTFAVKMNGVQEDGVFLLDHEELDENNHFVAYLIANNVQDLLKKIRNRE